MNRPPSREPAGRHPGDGWELAAPFPMSAGMIQALHGLVRATCPLGEAPWSDDLERRVVRSVRVHLRYLNPAMAWALVASMPLIDYLAVPVTPARRPLHRLQRVEASEAFSKLQETAGATAGLPLVAVKALVLTYYFDQDEVHEAMDYRPMQWFRDRLTARQRLVDGELQPELQQVKP